MGRQPWAASLKAAHGSWPPRLLNFSTTQPREQSENVYENKGQGQKVYGLRGQGVEKWKAKCGPRALGGSPEGGAVIAETLSGKNNPAGRQPDAGAPGVTGHFRVEGQLDLPE